MTENEPASRGIDDATMVSSEPIRAAGAVLWRTGVDGIEVALVHRPRYDDWSLPKGKLHRGELPQHSAVREVAEETGHSCVLSRFLTRVNYTVPQSGGEPAPKVVDYFAARAGTGFFTPNNEVDELRWLNPTRARGQLTYPHDVEVLDAFQQLPTDSATVLLVRHAKAGKRSEWTGDDTQRPLTEPGRRQRDAVHSLLSLFGPRRIYSAPRLRCEQTVAPLAAELGIDIATEPLFSEEGYLADPAGASTLMLRVAAGPGTAVVCSQGAVVPDLVTRLADSAGLELGKVASKKGSVWTLTFSREGYSGKDGSPALRLAAADYLANPLGSQ